MDKRFNIDDKDVAKCRNRIVEIYKEMNAHLRATHSEMNDVGARQESVFAESDLPMEEMPIETLSKIVALTEEIAVVRGRQQEHALRCAAEMKTILSARVQ